MVRCCPVMYDQYSQVHVRLCRCSDVTSRKSGDHSDLVLYMFLVCNKSTVSFIACLFIGTIDGAILNAIASYCFHRLDICSMTHFFVPALDSCVIENSDHYKDAAHKSYTCHLHFFSLMRVDVADQSPPSSPTLPDIPVSQ